MSPAARPADTPRHGCHAHVVGSTPQTTCQLWLDALALWSERAAENPSPGATSASGLSMQHDYPCGPSFCRLAVLRSCKSNHHIRLSFDSNTAGVCHLCASQLLVSSGNGMGNSLPSQGRALQVATTWPLQQCCCSSSMLTSRNMEAFMDVLRFCNEMSLLTPKDVCVLRSTCTPLQAMHVSWLQYKGVIHLDVSDASAYSWAWRNIMSIRRLSVKSATEQQMDCLLRDAKVLTTLDIADSNISTLPPLPQQLKHLTADRCDSLVHLPTLPASLEGLICVNCFELQQLPPLQHTNITELVISGSSVEKLEQLPNSLRRLRCNCCVVLEHLTELPEGLQVLCADNCGLLEVSICHLPR